MITYKKMFTSIWFWPIVLILSGINMNFVYQDYGSLSIYDIVGSLVFCLTIVFLFASFFWVIAYGFNKTFNRNNKT